MFTSHTKVVDIPYFTQLVREGLVQSQSRQRRFVLLLQMDDGFLEQFPIGAINHIGLPESTLPKEVKLQTVSRRLNSTFELYQQKKTRNLAACLVCLTGDSGSAIRLLCSA